MTPALDTAPQGAPAAVTKRRRFYAPELDSLRFLAFMLVFCRHIATSYGAATHRNLPPAGLNAQAGLNAHAGLAVPAGLAVHAAAAVPPSHLSPLWLRIQSGAGAFDFGVCLFFFLSSYLITRLLLIEKKETATVDVKDFYVRRALRIWPLYFVFLGVVAVFAHHLPHVTWPRILASVFFVANWPAVLYGWAVSPIDVLWSVSVEEQFYLVWPHFAKRGKKGVVAVSVAMASVAAATLFYLGTRPHIVLNSAVWANTFVQCLFFAGGATAGVYLKPERFHIPRMLRLALLLLGFACWLVASMACHLAREVSPGPAGLLAGYALVLVGTLCIFLSFARLNPSRIPRLFTYLGKISYGLYVLHVLLLELSIAAVHYLVVTVANRHPSLILLYLASAVCALLATALVASASYRFLESPFLLLKKRFTVVLSRPI